MTRRRDGRFDVHLDNFSGPFDLLLQLISRHKLDITEVALSQVTDEFIGHIKAAGSNWDLDQTSQFIVVAATLLDLKAARLIPSGEVDDPEDLALLEARDLLFARLLQYRAYKQVAAWLALTLEAQARRHPRQVGPGAAVRPAAARGADLDQSRAVRRPGRQGDGAQAGRRAVAGPPARADGQRPRAGLADRGPAAAAPTLTFRALTGDSPNLVTTVARFLALLELFREGAVSFEQLTPLGELTIRWTGADDGELDISDEFDAPSPRPTAEPTGRPTS